MPRTPEQGLSENDRRMMGISPDQKRPLSPEEILANAAKTRPQEPGKGFETDRIGNFGEDSKSTKEEILTQAAQTRPQKPGEGFETDYIGSGEAGLDESKAERRRELEQRMEYLRDQYTKLQQQKDTEIYTNKNLERGDQIRKMMDNITAEMGRVNMELGKI